jgi:hypothetical protein
MQTRTVTRDGNQVLQVLRTTPHGDKWFDADRRQTAIEREDHRCESCGWLAWSFTRESQLEIREREGVPDRPHCFCPSCAGSHDEKTARRLQRRTA